MTADTSRTASRCILSAALLISSLVRSLVKPRHQRRLRRRALDVPHRPRQLQQALALAIVEFPEIDAGAGLQGAVSCSTASSSRSIALSTRLSITVPFSSIRPCAGAHRCRRRATVQGKHVDPTSRLTPLTGRFDRGYGRDRLSAHLQGSEAAGRSVWSPASGGTAVGLAVTAVRRAERDGSDRRPSRRAMPTWPLRASSSPIFSASIDLQNSPALPLPNTVVAFFGSIDWTKLCSTKASNWP